MIFKLSSVFVSDQRLGHLLRANKICLFLLPKQLSIHRNFNWQGRKPKHCGIIQSVVKMSSTKTTLFEGKEDRFEGITVVSEKEECAIEEFADKLKNSLKVWIDSKKRGIWFKVHLSQSDWVPILVKNGFRYHHAKEDYVMLYCWLPSHESNNIPPYAHTMVGVGAVVVNDRDQVLVVREKYFYKIPMWKLPGGYVEPGENLVDAAIREVMEETGIKAQFQTLLTLRQTHHGMFGCSDIYVVVNLKALTEDISKCEREIAECRWMDIEEYLSHPNVHELNRFFVQKLVDYRKYNIKIDCHHGVHQLLQKPYTVYSVEKKENEASSRPFSVNDESNSSKSS